jgi:GNAT superfamily N-acetyltransferase
MSPSMELEVEEAPDPADIAFIEARVAGVIGQQTGHSDQAQLGIFQRDESGQVLAGIYGWTWGGCCELAHWWVDPERRGQGLGTRLFAAAEAEAERRGCGQVVLFTHTAPAELYRAMGYELVGRVDDYPEGDAALWFRKRLTPAGPDDPSTVVVSPV